MMKKFLVIENGRIKRIAVAQDMSQIKITDENQTVVEPVDGKKYQIGDHAPTKSTLQKIINLFKR